MLEIRHGTANAVIDLFKLMVASVLNGSDDFTVKAGQVKDIGLININCWAPKNKVGLLLGSNRNGQKTPRKYSMEDVLTPVAVVNGFKMVRIWINNYDEMESDIQRRREEGKQLEEEITI